ncbi:MAG: hypothetical protein VCF08_00125 [Alphaproteobacteria bacterium]
MLTEILNASRIRVWVVESPVPWSEGMKLFKKEMEPALKTQKKAGLLKSYKVVQTGPNSGWNILEYETKAKMNKVIKATLATRESVGDQMGGPQMWVYTGQVKTSG